MAKQKKPKRNYRGEYETERKNFTRITVKIEKEKAELFKQKIQNFGISVQEYFRICIDHELNAEEQEGLDESEQ